ncbi:hypothetical protein ASD40_11435 [Paenibacillus sp. Root444D2]|nr:hypothetical protein ASD40_11435 [Paenibacillus sp. Root444D2]
MSEESRKYFTLNGTGWEPFDPSVDRMYNDSSGLAGMDWPQYVHRYRVTEGELYCAGQCTTSATPR